MNNTKIKNSEIDFDFIGGQEPLTKEEELAISEFIRAAKSRRLKRNLSRRKLSAKKKTLA